MEGTIKFTTCAVSMNLLWSHFIHSDRFRPVSSSSFLSRWERLRPSVLPLQGGTSFHWWPQRSLPGVSNTFRFSVSRWDTWDYGHTVGPSTLHQRLLFNPGTCWSTQLTWGSGCPQTPKTSSLFTVKEGKVPPKILICYDCWSSAVVKVQLNRP